VEAVDVLKLPPLESLAWRRDLVMLFLIPAMKLLFWPLLYSLGLIISGLLAEDIDLSNVLASSLFLQRRQTPLETSPSILTGTLFINIFSRCV